MNDKDGNSNSNSNLFIVPNNINKKEEKNDAANYQITEKVIKGIKKKGRRIKRSKTSKSLIIRSNKKRKTFDNSFQVLKILENNFNNNEKVNSYNDDKKENNIDINININNRNSIEVYNKNTKDLNKKVKKKEFTFLF